MSTLLDAALDERDRNFAGIVRARLGPVACYHFSPFLLAAKSWREFGADAAARFRIPEIVSARLPSGFSLSAMQPMNRARNSTGCTVPVMEPERRGNSG